MVETVRSKIFLMVYPMMINLQIAKVFAGGDFKLQAITQIINFAVVPFFAFGIGKLFFNDRPLILLGLLLTSLLPTSGMTISWTGFAKGNLNAAIKMTVIGLIAGSLATPLYAKFLMGTVVEIPLIDVFKQIVIIVFLPMLLGFVTKKALIATVGEMYDNFLDFVQESDLRATFTQLRHVSQNKHKVAFERCLNSRSSKI